MRRQRGIPHRGGRMHTYGGHGTHRLSSLEARNGVCCQAKRPLAAWGRGKTWGKTDELTLRRRASPLRALLGLPLGGELSGFRDGFSAAGFFISVRFGSEVVTS